VAHADHVELTADFLDWGVLGLARAGVGVWEARVAIPPGSHRVSIRIDGGPWIVPPGPASGRRRLHRGSRSAPRGI